MASSRELMASSREIRRKRRIPKDRAFGIGETNYRIETRQIIEERGKAKKATNRSEFGGQEYSDASKSKHRRRKKTTKQPTDRLGQENDVLEAQMTLDIADSLRSPLLSPRGYAEFALESYKKERGSDHIDYIIVQTVGCCRVLQIVPGYEGLGVLDCCHVSFFVRSSRPGSNKVLFFAELVDFCYGDQFVLNSFSILKLDSPDIAYGCGFCPLDKRYPHPRDAYFAGEGDYVPTNDTAQKELAVRFEQALTNRLKGTRTTFFNYRCSLSFQPEPFEHFVLDPSLRSPHLSTLGYAKLALKYYGELHNIVDANYEIVNALSSYRILSHVPRAGLYEVVDWCHLSFTAKPRNSNCKDDIVLFFVELADFSYGDRLALNYFSISKLDAPDVTYGCGFCPHDKHHPHILGAHFAGLWDHKATKVSSQKEMAVCFQRQVMAKRKKENFDQYERRKLLPKLVERDRSCFSRMLSDHEYAQIALSYISEAEAAGYKLVKTMYCNRQRCIIGMNGYGHWCHVYFIAKCKQNGKASRVHFFAELNDPGVRKFSLSTYCRMDARGVGMEQGCGICPISEKYRHPDTDFYIAGAWPHFGCWSHDNSLQCSRCIKIEVMKNSDFMEDPLED